MTEATYTIIIMIMKQGNLTRKSVTHMTPLFWTKSTEKSNVGKLVQQIRGFYYYVVAMSKYISEYP